MYAADDAAGHQPSTLTLALNPRANLDHNPLGGCCGSCWPGGGFIACQLKLLTKIVLWWVAGFVVVMLATAAVIAQGNPGPDCHFSLHQPHEWCFKHCGCYWTACKDISLKCNRTPVPVLCHCVCVCVCVCVCRVMASRSRRMEMVMVMVHCCWSVSVPESVGLSQVNSTNTFPPTITKPV